MTIDQAVDDAIDTMPAVQPDVARMAAAKATDVAPARPAAHRAGAVDELLAHARKIDNAGVRKALGRVDTALDVLRDRVAEHVQRAEADRRLAAERQAAQEAVRKAERELADAKRKLADLGKAKPTVTPKPKRRQAASRKVKRYQPGVDYQCSAVRDWAKAQGRTDFPARGAYLPDELVAEYLTATGGEA